MLNVPDREETAKHFLAPLLPGGRNHKRRQGPKEAAGMGLAYRQVGLITAGASWVTRALLARKNV
jgi:hypothetical protein